MRSYKIYISLLECINVFEFENTPEPALVPTPSSVSTATWSALVATADVVITGVAHHLTTFVINP